MSYRKIDKGVSTSALVKNLNAEFIGGVQYNRFKSTAIEFSIDTVHDGILLKTNRLAADGADIIIRIDGRYASYIVDTKIVISGTNSLTGTAYHFGYDLGDVYVLNCDGYACVWLNTPFTRGYSILNVYVHDSYYRLRYDSYEFAPLPTDADAMVKLTTLVTPNNYSGKAFDIIDLPSTISTLDVSSLPPIANVSEIILRYNGVVKDLGTYMASAPITLGNLIQQGVLDEGTTAQDLVDLGVIEANEEFEDLTSTDVEIPKDKLPILQNHINGKIEAKNQEIVAATQGNIDKNLKAKGVVGDNTAVEVEDAGIMPLINLDDYVGTPNNWLKIFVPNNQLESYKKAYPGLELFFYAISTNSPYSNIHVSGVNLLKGTKNFSKLASKDNVDILDETFAGTSIAKIKGQQEVAKIAYNNVLEPNTTYVLSFYAKGNAEINVFGAYRNTEKILYNNKEHIFIDKAYGQIRFVASANWERYVICFKTVSELIALSGISSWNEVPLQIRLEANNPASNYIDVAAVKLEKGTIPTDWTPAPEDTPNHWTGNNSQFDNITNKDNNTLYFITED